MTDKHVRVYYSIRDDEKFDEVYPDDAKLACWLRLLLDADAAYPAPASLPRSVKARPLAALVAAGLVDLLPGDMFRLHGMEAERNRRAEAGRAGGLASGASRGRSTPVPDTVERRPEQSFGASLPQQRQAEHSKAEHSNGDGEREDVHAFFLVRRRYPTMKQQQVLDEVLDRHDVTGPAWAAGVILKNPDDPIGAVLAADKVWRDERIEAAKAAERKPPPVKRRAGLPEHTRELLAHWAEQKKAEA